MFIYRYLNLPEIVLYTSNSITQFQISCTFAPCKSAPVKFAIYVVQLCYYPLFHRYHPSRSCPDPMIARPPLNRTTSRDATRATVGCRLNSDAYTPHSMYRPACIRGSFSPPPLLSRSRFFSRSFCHSAGYQLALNPSPQICFFTICCKFMGKSKA